MLVVELKKEILGQRKKKNIWGITRLSWIRKKEKRMRARKGKKKQKEKNEQREEEEEKKDILCIVLS